MARWTPKTLVRGTQLSLGVLLAVERSKMVGSGWLLGGVAGVSLAVGGVGILAVMLMSERERTHEIGLRRAMGTTRRDIRNQFLVEVRLLSANGDLAGLAVGMGAAWVTSALGYWPTLVSWPAAAGAFLFSAGLGVLFGLYPALLAAAMEPTEALRAE